MAMKYTPVRCSLCGGNIVRVFDIAPLRGGEEIRYQCLQCCRPVPAEQVAEKMRKGA